MGTAPSRGEYGWGVGDSASLSQPPVPRQAGQRKSFETLGQGAMGYGTAWLHLGGLASCGTMAANAG